MVLTYGNDCTLISKDGPVIDELTATLTNQPDKYAFIDKGTISTDLGVEISTLPNNEDFVVQTILDRTHQCSSELAQRQPEELMAKRL
jgi:hypothetical protein